MAESIEQSSWKTNDFDTEKYRNEKLEELEINLKDFDFDILIAIENKCYDLSTSRENYDSRLQKVIEAFTPPVTISNPPRRRG